MTKEVKVFKCTVTMPIYIHFRCCTKEEAMRMAAIYFSDKEDVLVSDVEEVHEYDVDPEIVFGVEILPVHTIQ